LGFHPNNIKAFVKSEHFKPFLAEALQQLEQAARSMRQQPSYSWWKPPVGYEPKIVCVTFCNQGRHRSISSCEVLQHVLQENFNVQSAGVQLRGINSDISHLHLIERYVLLLLFI
jgi:hypothetical protein